jgi:hypothetical protein
LGVLFSAGPHLDVWEVREGALADPRVEFIKQKLRQRLGLEVRKYPLGILDNEPCEPSLIQLGGIVQASDPSWGWQNMGDGEKGHFSLIPTSFRGLTERNLFRG